ncbi:MAG: HAD family hydrolase, partial [Spirochaetota bacterium]
VSAIRAISFDGDMTLWDFNAGMRRALALALEELRRRVPLGAARDLSVDDLIRIRDAVASEHDGGGLTHEAIRLLAFERTLETVGHTDPALAREVNALYMKHRFEDIELYPDTITCLNSLRDRYVLGLITNGNGYPARCGLPGTFRFVVLSQEVGAAKPAPRMFHAACAEADVSPRELMHVGDSITDDVAGANGVGAVSVWLNRDRARNDTPHVPDFEIESLRELPPLVDRIRGRDVGSTS